jgi:putative heme-binding domain-containing protein
MKRLSSLFHTCLLLAACGVISAQDHLVRETEPLTPDEELKSFRIRDGFEIALFASEPMINKPINLAVDARGRVWVSSTVEYPYAAAKDRWSDEQGTRVRDSRDAIKILEDTDGDGRADKVTDFADGLNIPTGVLPWHRPEHRDGCIAWSIPNIWYFADTDGDGRADHREVLFGPLGYEKDTHGMCSSFRLGSDGWVYATHGFNNTSHLKAKDGSEIELQSGNVFRFRPDGSRVEVWSRGQVNPFGLAFDRRGNLYSADCHSAPVYQLLRGAHYPSFGKPHDGLGFAPAMIEHTHGSTGIAGIVYVDRGFWGKGWDDHVFIGNPVTSKVNLDRIGFTGTTPRATELPDFIASNDPWFRPVDLTLGPGGALYIADFYNRIIGHYEVPLDHPGRDRERGRIWRVTKVGERAVSQAVEPLAVVGDPLKALADESPWTRRAGAAVLQEAPSIEGIEPLRIALRETPEGDTHLRHALKLALRDCLALPEAYSGRPASDAADSEVAIVSLAVKTPAAAAWLAGFSTPEMMPSDFAEQRRLHIARYGEPRILGRLVSAESVPSRHRSALEHAAVMINIAETLEDRDGVVREKIVLEALTRKALELLNESAKAGEEPWRVRSVGRSSSEHSGWEVQPRKSPNDGDINVLSSLVRGAKGAEQSVGVVESRPFAMPERLRFFLCGHRGAPVKDAHELNHVRLVDVGTGEELAHAYPPRSDTAVPVEWQIPDKVGKMVRFELVDGDAGSSYAWLGAGEFEGVTLPVSHFQQSDKNAAALRRLARLLVTSAPVDLRDRLRPYLPEPPSAPPSVITPEERARLDALITDRVAAASQGTVDLKRGEALYATHCAACHRVGGEGGLIGPQLDGVGTRGIGRLAEDILDPNRNVDAHFRLTVLTKKDGSVIGGFIPGESGEVIHFLDAAGQSHRVLKSEVEKTEVSPHSLMPAQFGELLKPEEFSDLAGWLLGK